MKLHFIQTVLFLSVFILGFIACEDDDPVIPNEEELITSLNYILSPDAGGPSVIFSFLDLDGEGGNPPVITGDTLAANTSYSGEIQLFNEIEMPRFDIGAEVQAEDVDHQFFFAAEDGLDLSIAYDDADPNGNPLGLRTSIMTGVASLGNIRIILQHEPDKFATGVREGNPTNAGGETDIELAIPVIIE